MSRLDEPVDEATPADDSVPKKAHRSIEWKEAEVNGGHDGEEGPSKRPDKDRNEGRDDDRNRGDERSRGEDRDREVGTRSRSHREYDRDSREDSRRRGRDEDDRRAEERHRGGRSDERERGGRRDRRDERDDRRDRHRGRDRDDAGPRDRERDREHERRRRDEDEEGDGARGRGSFRGRDLRDRSDADGERSERKRRRRDDDDGDDGDDRDRKRDRDGRNRDEHERDGAGGEPQEAAAAPAPRERKPVVLGRSGGAYIPPFRLAQMMKEAEADKSSEQYQRMTWEALRKSLNGVINKVNASNIKHILPELFNENLIRGQGLLCRCIMKAQAASVSFTPVFAALMAVVNTKFPEIGLLLVSRVLQQFKRAFRRNDKPVCTASLQFLAHFVNQSMVSELIALEVLYLLLEAPTDDSVEVAIAFVKEVGAALEDRCNAALLAIMDRFRAILQEGNVEKRTQYTIEGMFAIRKAGFESQGFVSVKPELDLVEEDDQITHEIDLATKHETNNKLDVFKADPLFEQHEAEWEAIRKELLGDEDAEGEDGEGSDSDDEEEPDEGAAPAQPGKPTVEIHDKTEANLVNLRRTIYLTIMSSMDFEESGFKLMKLKLEPGQEVELCSMLCECCANEKTFLRYYALLAQRFALKFRNYRECLEDLFGRQFALCHRLDTNKLRNLSKFFAHLVGTEAISWAVLQCIRLTEADTTSASRIFVKYFFQELSEHLGLRTLNQKLAQPELAPFLAGVFPRDSMENMRFSINFFTAIGLGGITDTMRADLKSLQEQMAILKQQQALAEAASSDSDSSGSSDSDSDSDSDDSSSSSESDSD